MIKGECSMIPTIVVSHKRNLHITKIDRAGKNKTVSIMKVIEPDICLPKRTRLNRAESNPHFITKEILKNIPNCSKGYLLLWQWLDCGDGKITIPRMGWTHHHTRHQLTTLNLHTLKTPRDKGRGINKAECYGGAFHRWSRVYCS